MEYSPLQELSCYKSVKKHSNRDPIVEWFPEILDPPQNVKFKIMSFSKEPYQVLQCRANQNQIDISFLMYVVRQNQIGRFYSSIVIHLVFVTSLIFDVD